MTDVGTRNGYHSQPRTRESGGIITTLAALLFLALLCLSIYLARHPLLRFAGDQLIVEDALEKSDAIIILSDDNFYADRATRAAELYRQNLAPVVVASGVRLRPYAGISELMTHDLIERGVPKERILPFPQDADNTREEVLALKPLVLQKGWKSVVFVTSNYHTRRARYIVRTIFPSDVRVEMASARDADFDPANWYQRRKAVKRFTHEVAGLFLAHWEH
jgi:uncharacterized SAM-binding protein YcdF (DUF218 family)